MTKLLIQLQKLIICLAVKLSVPLFSEVPNAAAGVGAQHSQCYASWYAHIPGLKVVAPYDATDCKALKKAIRDENPVIFLENEITYGYEFELFEDQIDSIEIGKAKIVKQGTDVTITAFSIMVEKAIKAAEELEKLGISAEVIDLRTIRPLDTDTIFNSVKKPTELSMLKKVGGFVVLLQKYQRLLLRIYLTILITSQQEFLLSRFLCLMLAILRS